jgi:excinuclease ABC subunit C
VDGLFARRSFTTFGPNPLGPAPPALGRVAGARATRLRAGVRKDCPRRPGVYGMLDARGQLIYVGKAKCLRARLLSYFRPNSRDAKAGRILERTRVIVWEPAPSEFAALLRELQLIRRWRPQFNVAGQPSRRGRAYVCLGRRPAPYVFLARRPPAGALGCYGPVPAGHTAREAVRRVNDWFRLRDCPQAQEMVFADQAELFPVLRAAGCLRYEIGTCLGPCAAACTRPAYTDQVRAARAFLEGTDTAPLEALRQEIAAAAAALAYERAAAVRDKLEVLLWLRKQLTRLRRLHSRPAVLYPVAGHDGQDLWYLIQHGRVTAALPAPRTAAEHRAAAQRIREVLRQDAAARFLAAEEMEGVLLVASWFRRHAPERARLLDPAAVLRACRRTR